MLTGPNVTLFNIGVFSVRLVLTIVEFSSSCRIFIVSENNWAYTFLEWPTFHPPLSSRFRSDDTKEVVHYQTISPKSLAKSVLEEGGWSNFMVSIPLVKLKLSFNLFFQIINSCIETSSISSLMSWVSILSVQGRILRRVLMLPLFLLAQRYLTLI